MEEGEVNAVRLGNRRQRLLRFVKRPASRKVAAVFGAVRVPQHHDLAISQLSQVISIQG